MGSLDRLGGFAKGAIVGGSAGAASGFSGGSLGAWANGASLGKGLKSGVIGAGIGGASGALLSGLNGGIRAARRGASFWDGSITENVYADGTTPLAEGDIERARKVAKEKWKFRKGTYGNRQITEKPSAGYEYRNGKLFDKSENAEVFGYVKKFPNGASDLHISKAIIGNDRVLTSTLGHEIIHTFHHNTYFTLYKNVGYTSFHKSFTENAAYSWEIDYLKSFSGSGLESLINFKTKILESTYSLPNSFIIEAYKKFYPVPKILTY